MRVKILRNFFLFVLEKKESSHDILVPKDKGCTSHPCSVVNEERFDHSINWSLDSTHREFLCPDVYHSFNKLL